MWFENPRNYTWLKRLCWLQISGPSCVQGNVELNVARKHLDDAFITVLPYLLKYSQSWKSGKSRCHIFSEHFRRVLPRKNFRTFFGSVKRKNNVKPVFPRFSKMSRWGVMGHISVNTMARARNLELPRINFSVVAPVGSVAIGAPTRPIEATLEIEE